jgi:hypothetical protein
VPGRLAEQVEALIGSFADYVAAFEASGAFPGPSLYFHMRAIERRRQHQTAKSLLDDHLFLEHAYAVLPAWGMHRMGALAAKVGDFAQIVNALRQEEPRTAAAVAAAHHDAQPTGRRRGRSNRLGHHRSHQGEHVADPDRGRQRNAPPSTARPDPADRPAVHIQLLHRSKAVASDRNAFLDWYPQLAAIGARCQQPIYDAIKRGGFMATGEAKVIDNAIMGFMQQRRTSIGAPASVPG